MLFYLFQEAELISSPLKNSTKTTTKVEFNGFDIEVKITKGDVAKKGALLKDEDAT